MFGLHNWEPVFVDTTDEVLGLCRQIHADIIGHKVECSWVPCLQKDDKWWQGAPVILRINSINYEFCWQKESDCAVTRNTINIEEPVRWCDCDELAFFWKKDGLPALQNIVGQQVNGIDLLEAEVTISNHSEGFQNNYWLPYGINFKLCGGFLSIYNAFDLNGVTDNINDYPSPYGFGTNRVADGITANDGFRLISL